jgi:hypothetical protein
VANRITRLFRETLGEGSPLARVSRLFREIFAEGAPKARVSRVFRETLAEGAPKARVSRVFREIFADNPVVVIPPFHGATGEHDDGVAFELDDFDYDEIPALVLVAGQPVILAEPEEPAFDVDGFDYNDDGAGLIVRRLIHAHLFVIR